MAKTSLASYPACEDTTKSLHSVLTLLKRRKGLRTLLLFREEVLKDRLSRTTTHTSALLHSLAPSRLNFDTQETCALK